METYNIKKANECKKPKEKFEVEKNCVIHENKQDIITEYHLINLTVLNWPCSCFTVIDWSPS